jgi:hypothetical protein
MVSHDESELLVYFPDRTPATLRLDYGIQQAQKIHVQATWFDPASGTTEAAGTYTAYAPEGGLIELHDSFTPPREWLDAVLVLTRKKQ